MSLKLPTSALNRPADASKVVFMVTDDGNAHIGIAKDPDHTPACEARVELWARSAEDVNSQFALVQGNAVDVGLAPNFVYWLRVLVNPTGQWEEATCTNKVPIADGRVYEQGWSDNHPGPGEPDHFDFHTSILLT